jgi:hypothetical protein
MTELGRMTLKMPTPNPVAAGRPLLRGIEAIGKRRSKSFHWSAPSATWNVVNLRRGYGGRDGELLGAAREVRHRHGGLCHQWQEPVATGRSLLRGMEVSGPLALQIIDRRRARRSRPTNGQRNRRAARWAFAPYNSSAWSGSRVRRDLRSRNLRRTEPVAIENRSYENGGNYRNAPSRRRFSTIWRVALDLLRV